MSRQLQGQGVDTKTGDSNPLMNKGWGPRRSGSVPHYSSTPGQTGSGPLTDRPFSSDLDLPRGPRGLRAEVDSAPSGSSPWSAFDEGRQPVGKGSVSTGTGVLSGPGPRRHSPSPPGSGLEPPSRVPDQGLVRQSVRASCDLTCGHGWARTSYRFSVERGGWTLRLLLQGTRVPEKP